MRTVRVISLMFLAMLHFFPVMAQDSLVYRLKVEYARSIGLDTLPEVQQELTSLRRQLSASYFVEDAALESQARSLYNNFQSTHKAGTVWALQVYRHLPQNVTQAQLDRASRQMDSIYRAIQNGASFDEMVARYSESKDTLKVGWLQMPAEFEDKVFSMKSGEYSAPFYTPQGIHLVKVIRNNEGLTYDSVKDGLINRQKSLGSLSASQVENLKKVHHFVRNDENCKDLLRRGTTDRVLFMLDGKEYSGTDFELFSQAYPYSLSRQLEAFILKSLLELEILSLDQQHPELAESLEHCQSDLLVNLATNREVIQPSHDEWQLKAFFDSRRDDYQWETPRFKGIVIHAKNKKQLKRARKLIKSRPYESWDELLAQAYGNEQPALLTWSQGIFGPGDNDFVDADHYKVRSVEPLTEFPYFVVYGKKQKTPEDYRAVPHETLVADFQAFLESQWIQRLKSQK